ncbi:hypothetical protein [Rhodococcus aetherivorans]|uniref:hypothetical protein n=1 Tax=Rhodococcus aetherivorans TaxID=191292 RepID=UPI00388FE380
MPSLEDQFQMVKLQLQIVRARPDANRPRIQRRIATLEEQLHILLGQLSPKYATAAGIHDRMMR